MSPSTAPSDDATVATHHEAADKDFARAKLLRRLARREPRAGEDLSAAPRHPENHKSAPQSGRASEPERKSKRKFKKVYCGNNRLDPSLRINGGHLEIGTRAACMRAGFGAALHQHEAQTQIRKNVRIFCYATER